MPSSGYTTIRRATTSTVISSSARVIYSIIVHPAAGTRTEWTVHDDATGTAGGTAQNISVRSGSAASEKSVQEQFVGVRFGNGVYAELVAGTGTLFVEIS